MPALTIDLRSQEARLAGAVVVGVVTAAGTVYLVRRSSGSGVEVLTAAELRRYADGGLLRTAAARLWMPRVCAVRVTGQRLPCWPAGLGSQAASLRELDLSGTGLAELPASVGSLEQLTRLALARNDLSTLPAELGRLSRLLDMDVGGNRLEALPEELCALSGLRNLNAQGNALAALPSGLGGLRGLRRLGLKGNVLRELPASVGGLVGLQELYLTDNRLEELPESLGGCTALVKLQASAGRRTGAGWAATRCVAGLAGRVRGQWAASLPSGGASSLPARHPCWPAVPRPAAAGGRPGSAAPDTTPPPPPPEQASFNPLLRRLPSALGSLPCLELLRAACCDIDLVPSALHAAPRLAWLSLASNPVCRAASPRQRGVPQVAHEELDMGRKLGEAGMLGWG